MVVTFPYLAAHGACMGGAWRIPFASFISSRPCEALLLQHGLHCRHGGICQLPTPCSSWPSSPCKVGPCTSALQQRELHEATLWKQ